MNPLKKIQIHGEQFGFRDDTKVPVPEQDGTSGQILRTNGDGTTRWDNAATQEEIGSAVESWLEENIAGGEAIALDASLSVSGTAADSKSTGDAIQSVSQIVNGLPKTSISDGNSDLDISDNNGNVLVRFANGHIQTKNFDSSDVHADVTSINGKIGAVLLDHEDVGAIAEPENDGASGQVLATDGNGGRQWATVENDTPVKHSTKQGIDLDLSDPQGNVILRLAGGHIQTRYFDSKALAQKMIYPSGFVSRLKPNVYRIGKKYFTDFDITAHKLTGSGIAWVDAAAASGGDGTEDSPFNNVNNAISSGAATIYLKPGTYTLGIHFNDQTDIAGKNVIGIGQVLIDCTNATNGPWRCRNGSAYLENVEIMGGVYAFYAQIADSDTLYLYRVRLHDTSNNALCVLGGNIYAVECTAYNAAFDGFNYHANGANIPNVVEVDCIAHDCGDGTRDSDNGSTIHDGESIVRIGGEYYKCHGGVVADKGYDQNTPSYSLNYGVYAHDSTHEIPDHESYRASFWAEYAKMWLFDCVASGSLYDISSSQYAEVFSSGLMSEDPFTPSDITRTGGTIKRIGGM